MIDFIYKRFIFLSDKDPKIIDTDEEVVEINPSLDGNDLSFSNFLNSKKINLTDTNTEKRIKDILKMIFLDLEVIVIFFQVN